MKSIVSGSTKGIGFETAKLFLKEGASVIINGRTDKSVNEAISELNNPNVKGITADFSTNRAKVILFNPCFRTFVTKPM